MEMLDQKRRVAGPFAQKCAHLRKGRGIDLATFRMGTATTAPRSDSRWDQRNGRHRSSPHTTEQDHGGWIDSLQGRLAGGADPPASVARHVPNA
jgi:hypothetical protein